MAMYLINLHLVSSILFLTIYMLVVLAYPEDFVFMFLCII